MNCQNIVDGRYWKIEFFFFLWIKIYFFIFATIYFLSPFLISGL
jgi:hypothetical protein